VKVSGGVVHASFTQPFGHVICVSTYEHMPLTHMPGSDEETSVPPWHFGSGGVVHEVAVHVCKLHAPFMHPCGHCVSVGVFSQRPVEGLQPALKVRSVFALGHVACGGSQTTPLHLFMPASLWLPFARHTPVWQTKPDGQTPPGSQAAPS
jgi:hypothetical protein